MKESNHTVAVDERYNYVLNTGTKDAIFISPIQVRIPASPEYVRVIREIVDCLCRLRSLPDDTRSSIKLAVGEAVNNAVLYGRVDKEGSTVDVTVTLGESILEIEVINESNGFALNAPSKMPDAELLAERGRGLALMKIMMDEVEYFDREGKTVALLRKCLD